MSRFTVEDFGSDRFDEINESSVQPHEENGTTEHTHQEHVVSHTYAEATPQQGSLVKVLLLVVGSLCLLALVVIIIGGSFYILRESVPTQIEIKTGPEEKLTKTQIEYRKIREELRRSKDGVRD